MNNKSDKQYMELKDNFMNSIKEDEFYELFNRSIKSGKNNFSLYQKYMNNIIDENWVKAIEDTIIPIDNIIRNPMRFIKQEEEIVPIEQAKKISQESIRHLAQHTNMISRVEGDGMVTPSKILNIHKEETFATYENRFIYTLLKHVQYFIDKRLRILNDTKIQTENKISLESEFNIGKEKIKYEFSMTSIEKAEKNKTTIKLDEDTSQMDLQHRVERLRMILYDFQNSQLIKSLDGCLLVRPPIMRTNVILKNQNFKKAMELWTFIESYNDAGLTIQVIENEEMPNNDYIQEMFNLSLINYHLFNHHVKPGKDLEKELPPARELKPNLVRNTVEEYMDEFTMDIDDIERIFIDEIKRATKKRRENEQKIKKAIDRALKKEKDRKKKLKEQEKLRKEKARLLAKKEKEMARLEAKKAKELERLEAKKTKELLQQAIRNSVRNNVETLLNTVKENYPKAKVLFNEEGNNFKVCVKKHLLMFVKTKEFEYKITFIARKDFFNYFSEHHADQINIDGSSKLGETYKIVDNGKLDPAEIKALVQHVFKYHSEIEAEEVRIAKAKAKLLKKNTLSKAKLDQIVKKINEHINDNYSDIQIKLDNDENIKIARNRKLMNIIQINQDDIRVTFQAKESYANKLIEKYPTHIKNLGKGEQWYKLINKGEIKVKDILKAIDYSYKYLADAEAKAIAQKLKEKEKLKKQKSK